MKFKKKIQEAVDKLKKNPRLDFVTLIRRVSLLPYTYNCIYVNTVANSLMVTDKLTT